MNDMKKLRDEMQAQAATKFPQWSETLKWASTLDAYIKAQESAVPVCPYLQPRSGTHVCILSGASPPPREPISREALSDLIRSVRYCETTLDEFARALGIEVKP